MRKEDCFELGYIIKAKGLAGKITSYFDADDPERYSNIDAVFVGNDHQLIPYLVEEILQENDRFVLKLEEVDNSDTANALKGSKLYLPLSALPKLEEDEYFLHELVGFSIIDNEKGEIGEVDNVIDMNNNLLLSTVFEGKEILIPVNDAVVYKVDKTKKLVYTNLPEGLIDIYLEN